MLQPIGCYRRAVICFYFCYSPTRICKCWGSTWARVPPFLNMLSAVIFSLNSFMELGKIRFVSYNRSDRHHGGHGIGPSHS